MVSLIKLIAMLIGLVGLGMYAEYAARITYEVPKKGSAVLITGARRGLGLSAAKRLAKEGFHVFINVRKELDAKQVREQLNIKNIEPIVFDLMSDEGIVAAEKTIREWCKKNNQKFAGLINNAVDFRGTIIEVAPQKLTDEVLRMNTRQLLFTVQTFLPLLREGKGRIINVSSCAKELIITGLVLYASSKGFMDALTTGLRHELAGAGVAAITVKPGWMKNEQTNEFMAGAGDRLAEMYPHPYPELYKIDLKHKTKALVDMIRESETLEGYDSAVADAMLSPKPRLTYQMGGALPGVPSKYLVYLAWYLPESIFTAIMLAV